MLKEVLSILYGDILLLKWYYFACMFDKLKKVENLHIAFWLIKDTCWCLDFKPLALFMVVPTVGIALFIVWHTRLSRHDFFHNIAVTCWICANSIWMTGEFFFHDTLRPYALIFFGIGLLVVAWYYFFENSPSPMNGSEQNQS